MFHFLEHKPQSPLLFFIKLFSLNCFEDNIFIGCSSWGTRWRCCWRAVGGAFGGLRSVGGALGGLRSAGGALDGLRSAGGLRSGGGWH
jgi:hypothetical protein